MSMIHLPLAPKAKSGRPLMLSSGRQVQQKNERISALRLNTQSRAQLLSKAAKG